MRVIELTRGQVAIVDDEDFEQLAQYRWCFMTVGYAARRKMFPDGKSRIVYMHREIMGSQKGSEVDHRSTNKLDNRRENLRLATSGQNKYNQGKDKSNKSGFKGVHFSKKRQKWVAEIWADKKKYWLGGFFTPEDASLAYNSAAIRLHGEFANIN